MKKIFKRISIFLLVVYMTTSSNLFIKNVNAKENNFKGNLTLIENNFVNETLPYKTKIIKENRIQAVEKEIFLPTKYDLREHNKVTPVKDQGQIGDCWAFGAIASLESNLLTRENKEYDFSEINMATHQHKDTLKSGGNNMMATAYLASWKGPVLEKDDPYPNPANIENVVKKDNINPTKHVQNVIFIPDRQSSIDNQQIKENIYKKGGISTSIYLSADMRLINIGRETKTQYNYYCDEVKNINHVITIVGWDDNYSKDNFYEIKPPQNGAFICKNSYGKWFGDNGYFYVSYYDKNIGKNNAMYMNAENVDNYSKIYQYDMYEWNRYYNVNNSYFSNVFTVNNTKNISENLKAVSFYTIKEDTNYEIYVEEDYNEYGFTKIKSKKVKEGIIKMPGYHTIKLDNSIKINNNKKFAIAVKINTPMALSTIVDDTNKYGNSYMNYYGDYWKKTDGLIVCLKAFTNINETKLDGDVDKNGQVDIKDIALVAKKYNIKLGMSEYEYSYDFNKDNIIDIYDLVHISRNVQNIN